MTYCVAVQWRAKPGEEDGIRRVLEALAPATRAEDGCQLFLPAQDVADKSKFFVLEQYVDEAAFQAHLASEHFRRYVADDALGRLASRERSVLIPIGIQELAD
jgi:(4S)-4-hydroxy-5-phosphonooxypentane-2,3-dione isomerase